MSDEPSIIQLDNLTRTYGKLEAVHGLSLTVRPGCCYGFFGRNGAGKTTTIKCLLNLLRPTGGSVRVFGLTRRANLAFLQHPFGFAPWRLRCPSPLRNLRSISFAVVMRLSFVLVGLVRFCKMGGARDDMAL